MLRQQIVNARKVHELRKKIPSKLKSFIDFRAKATGLTLVSFFDFAAMRGLNVNDQTAGRVLDQLERQADFLISPQKDDREKGERFTVLGFRSRGAREEFLEEDVQAFLARELLSEGPSRDLPQRIASLCGCNHLKYLASELEWSLDGKKDRADILCYDENDSDHVIIVELKKVRITQLKQSRYIEVFERYQKDVKQFIAALIGNKCKVDRPLKVSMVYLMPAHPRLILSEWSEIARKNKVQGIIFYQKGYPAGPMVKGQ